MWYAFAGVLILKDSVSPAFTLIDVAKPWIVESPAPLTCQSLGGSPGCVFSHAITLDHGRPARAGRGRRPRVDQGNQAQKHCDYEANDQAWRRSLVPMKPSD